METIVIFVEKYVILKILVLRNKHLIVQKETSNKLTIPHKVNPIQPYVLYDSNFLRVVKKTKPIRRS